MTKPAAINDSSLFRFQRHATKSSLFIVGFAFSAWAALIPFLKMRTALDEGALGILLISLGVGATTIMPFAGSFASRYSCRLVVRIGVGIVCIVLPLLAYLENVMALRICLFCFGGAFGAVEVSANMQAVVLQRKAGRSLMSGFHAFYSIGSIAGAGLMTLFLWLGLKPLPATVVCVCIMAGLTIFFDKGVLPHIHNEQGKKVKHFAWPRGIVLVIGIVMLIAYMSEGSVANWAALFLVDYKGFEPEYGALGITIFSVTIAFGRLVGDKIAQKAGSSALLIATCCISSGVCYLLTINLLPGFWALLGYALMGLCLANLAPTLFTLTGRQKVMPVELAISSVTAVGYASALISSPSIGLVARYTSLATSLSVLSILLLLTAFSAYLFAENIKK